jgi:hypothetical protein
MKTITLYDIARQVTIKHGYDWTDPRTGMTYKARRKSKRVRTRKSKRVKR